jgi:hypothetical protein
MKNLKNLYLRLRYRKQLKQGFKLLDDNVQEFELIDARDFVYDKRKSN